MKVSFLSRLFGRLRGRNATSAALLKVVVYTRRGCHLCEGVLEQLQKVRREFNFAVKEIDVDRDASVKEIYGAQVPVVLMNGKIRFRGRVNEVLLKRMLRAEISRRR